MRGSRVFLFLSLIVLFVGASSFAAERPLTNEDVVAMVKADLGETVVIAKIAKALNVQFDTSPDALVKLKKSGVSQTVIAAMIERDSGAPVTVGTGTNGKTISVAPATAPGSKVRMITADGTVDLASYVGSESSTYVYVTMLFWLNFPGLHSAQRTHDAKPAFLLASDQDPRSRYFIVRLDVNDKQGDRSLKMGRSGMFSFKATSSPDNEWTFPFDSEHLSATSWKLTLKTPLKPGEYGVYAMQNTELYEFGID